MAADSHNAITGAPEFSDSGAPDIGVDPTLVAAYASDVGNRIVRANLAALEAYPYARAGLSGHAIDTGVDYLHDDTGWRVSYMPLTAWTPTVTGLAVGNGTLVTEYVRRGDVVDVFVEYTHGSSSSLSGSLQLSLPVDPANPSIIRHFGIGMLRVVSTSAQYPIQGRYTGGSAFSLVIPSVAGSAVGIGQNVSNTYPTSGAWGVGSTIYFQGTYKAAA